MAEEIIKSELEGYDPSGDYVSKCTSKILKYQNLSQSFTSTKYIFAF